MAGNGMNKEKITTHHFSFILKLNISLGSPCGVDWDYIRDV